MTENHKYAANIKSIKIYNFFDSHWFLNALFAINNSLKQENLVLQS
ncbi:hypothetical protein CWATWH8502_4679 [Crocosphaera watsonii WH 8502]|uniref:Uncharacterized protein n=1 Tax=Crocosphaera watsonii WH 8502 TaxID=423474 RepID=T2I7W3_CROWT|nr:hypothetical protein CWATWH8502_4679 [Crocosphaera watsonii WH 8502]